MKSTYVKYGTLSAAVILMVLLYYFFCNINSIKLEPGKITTRWVQSQNGNDDGALFNVKSAGVSNAKLKYAVEKYAEIGIIVLPDVDTVFSSLLDGRKIRDIGTAPFADGLTIIDHNKISYMDGVIKFWKVVSKEDNNEVRIAVFRYDEATKKYQLINASPSRNARKGLNTFSEEIPLTIKQNDILGLQTKKPIASNRVGLSEVASIVTRSGFQSSLDKSNMVEDNIGGGLGSFSFTALLEAGVEQGEISGRNDGALVIKLPENPVYGHVSWYKFTFISDAGVFSLKPGLASILLNADPYIGLIQDNTSPWTPKAFSFLLIISMLLLFACTAWLILPESIMPRSMWAIPQWVRLLGILIIFGLTRYFAPSFPGFQFVAIVAAFIMVFIFPGVIIARYYPGYGEENASGCVVLTFVLSLIYWLLPALGLFLVKTSYWPVIVAAVLLIVPVCLKQPVRQRREVTKDELSPYWKTFQFMLWGFVGLLVIHNLFSIRFHAELFDTFHHISLAAKNFALPVAGDAHANLHGVTMRTMAPYAYNVFGLLVGMVMKISGLDIGTVYCVGNSLLVLLLFIAQWWLIGLFVDSKKIKILAFAIIIIIYVTRSLAIFAVGLQSTEFNFIMCSPDVYSLILYAVYIVLGIRAINSKRSTDLFICCGLSLVTLFFHLQFAFINILVLFLLFMLSLREKGKFRFSRMHVYLLTTIALLVAAGFVVKSHLALGDIATDASGWHKHYYGLRYEDHTVLQRFYYLFKDLFNVINSYIWYAIAIWGGLLLVIFPSKRVSVRLFNTAYLIIILLLIFSYNPISDMVFTPLITNLPVQRITTYIWPFMLTLAAIILSASLFYVFSFTKKYLSNLTKFIYMAPVILLLIILLTYKQWLPQIKSTISAITYNQGNFLDITYVANLPELKYLNEYSKDKYLCVLVDYPYYYAIPSLSKTYSYFHRHYLGMDESITERESVWKKCVRGETNCKSELPEDSIVLVRNDDVARFVKIGYSKIFKGRLFTVLRI